MAQPPCFDQWFERIILFEMPHLCWCSILKSWSIYFGVHFHQVPFFCQSNSARNHPFHPPKCYVKPLPFAQKSQTSQSNRPILTTEKGVTYHHPPPSPKPIPQPTDGTAEPTCLGKQQLLESFLLRLRCALGLEEKPGFFVRFWKGGVVMGLGW